MVTLAWIIAPRGRASVLLSEGRWFDSFDLHVEVSLGNILNPKLHHMYWAATAISVWITVGRFRRK